jgi:hypothetical protein
MAENNSSSMKTLLKIEELALFAVCGWGLYAYVHEWGWWKYLALALLSDVSMVGYLVNARVGAWLYNLAHHKAPGLIALTFGLATGNSLWLGVGLIWVGHSAMDRIFGYGLKYESGFKDTHLGRIGGK